MAGNVIFQGRPRAAQAPERLAEPGNTFAARRRSGRRGKTPFDERRARHPRARENNLKNIDARIPPARSSPSRASADRGIDARERHPLPSRSRACCIAPAMKRALTTIDGIEQIDKSSRSIMSPIAATPRSNTRHLHGIVYLLRELFAMVPESKARGFRTGAFSFTFKGGRCEGCQGGRDRHRDALPP